MHALAVPAAIIVVSVAVSVGIAWFAIVRPSGRRLDGIERALKVMRRDFARLNEIVDAGTQTPAVAMSAPRSAASFDGELAKPPLMPAASMPVVSKRPEPAPPSRSEVRRDRTERYRNLLGNRGKPRQLQDVIEEDDEARAVTCAPDGSAMAFAAFNSNDPSQMLVALAGPDEGTFVILPTSEYLENFRVAFRSPVQNPVVVRSLFDLDQDDEDGLRILEPALVRVGETGLIETHRMGRMGGYSSAA